MRPGAAAAAAAHSTDTEQSRCTWPAGSREAGQLGGRAAGVGRSTTRSTTEVPQTVGKHAAAVAGSVASFLVPTTHLAYA